MISREFVEFTIIKIKCTFYITKWKLSTKGKYSKHFAIESRSNNPT